MSFVNKKCPFLSANGMIWVAHLVCFEHVRFRFSRCSKNCLDLIEKCDGLFKRLKGLVEKSKGLVEKLKVMLEKIDTFESFFSVSNGHILLKWVEGDGRRRMVNPLRVSPVKYEGLQYESKNVVYVRKTVLFSCAPLSFPSKTPCYNIGGSTYVDEGMKEY